MAKSKKLVAADMFNKAAERASKRIQAAAEDTIRNHEEYKARDLGRKYRANFYWPMLARKGAAHMLAHLVLKNASASYRKDFANHMANAPVSLAQDMIDRTPEAFVLENRACFKAELVAQAEINLDAFRAIAGVTPSFNTAEVLAEAA